MLLQLTAQFGSPSLEMVILMTTLVAEVLLAYVVYQSNPQSATSRIFALLSFATIGWLSMNYLNSAVGLPIFGSRLLEIHRLGIFFAAPMSALFLLLAHTMPSERLRISRDSFYALVALTILMMGVNLSPYAFTGLSPNNGALSPQPGLGLLPFSILSTIFSILAVYFLIRKYVQAKGVEREQISLVLSGIIIMLGAIICTILLPILLRNWLPFFSAIQFLPLTPLYTLIFLGMTAYAITRYQLFNIKVLVTRALTIVIWLVLFARVFGDDTLEAQTVDGIIFVVTLGLGTLLIKSVNREVKQRELIEVQEKELEKANKEQEILIHFITHQVKGFFTKSRNVFSMILEGDYGEVPASMKPMLEEGFRSDTQGVGVVQEILSAANIKRGTITYKKDLLDLKTLVEEQVTDLKSTAAAKHLALTLSIPEGKYAVTGDKEQLCHAVRNVIDNSIKYTPSGSVAVSLANAGSKLIFKVSDTGVGITPEDKEKLFTEGGHGKDSQKINVESTGFGLYIVKHIVEAHGGTVSAESAGAGKGSTFTIELPVLA